MNAVRSQNYREREKSPKCTVQDDNETTRNEYCADKEDAILFRRLL